MSVKTPTAYLRIARKTELTPLEYVIMPAHYRGAIRTESIMGYALLSQLLREQFGMDFDPTRIQLSPSGKPYLADSSIHFSISHCADYVACIVDTEPVGIDIEQARPFSARLGQRTLTARDVEAGVDPLTAWVIKEAYSKYRGLGLALSFGDYSAAELLDQHHSWLRVTNNYICAAFRKNSAETVELI